MNYLLNRFIIIIRHSTIKPYIFLCVQFHLVEMCIRDRCIYCVLYVLISGTYKLCTKIYDFNM